MCQIKLFPRFMNIIKIIFVFLGLLWADSIEAQEIKLDWKPREDLNTELPSSIKIYDTYGSLSDGKPLRAPLASSMENLK